MHHHRLLEGCQCAVGSCSGAATCTMTVACLRAATMLGWRRRRCWQASRLPGPHRARPARPQLPPAHLHPHPLSPPEALRRLYSAGAPGASQTLLTRHDDSSNHAQSHGPPAATRQNGGGRAHFDGDKPSAEAAAVDCAEAAPPNDGPQLQAGHQNRVLLLAAGCVHALSSSTAGDRVSSGAGTIQAATVP